MLVRCRSASLRTIFSISGGRFLNVIAFMRACSQVGKNIQSNGAGSYLRAGIGMGEEFSISEMLLP
jgi:hypothetical protein